MAPPVFLGATEFSLSAGTHSFGLNDAPAGSDLIMVWFNSGNNQAVAFPSYVGVSWLGVGDGSDGIFYDPGAYGYASQWLYVGYRNQLVSGTSFEVDLSVTAVVIGYATARENPIWPASEVNSSTEAQLTASSTVGSSQFGGSVGSPYTLDLGAAVVADYTMAIQFVSSRTPPTPTTSSPTSEMTQIHSSATSWIGERLDAATGAETIAAQRLDFGASTPRGWWSYWFILFDGPSLQLRGRRGLGLIHTGRR